MLLHERNNGAELKRLSAEEALSDDDACVRARVCGAYYYYYYIIIIIHDEKKVS